MQSSDCNHKNLSATIGTTSEALQHDGTPRDDSTHPGTRTGKLARTIGRGRALLGSLAARATASAGRLTDACPWASAGDDLEAHLDDAEPDPAQTASFIEDSPPTAEYGNRVKVETTYYGTDRRGQPLVPGNGAEQRARANANDRPHDRLLAATDADAPSHEPEIDRTYVRRDTRGERLVGVASGIDEHVGRIGLSDEVDPDDLMDAQIHPRPAPDAATTDDAPAAAADERTARTELPVRLQNAATAPLASLVAPLAALLAASTVPRSATEADPGDELASDATNEGPSIAEREVRLPSGEFVPLADVVDDPDRFRNSSIRGIEMSLAQQAEIQAVTDGILRDYEVAQAARAAEDPEPDAGATSEADPNEGPFLVGKANQVDTWYDEYADRRPTPEEVAAAREQHVREQKRQRLQPLADLDEQTTRDVCTAARRLSDSEEFDRAYEVRKTPLELAIALAEKVHQGLRPRKALLEQADKEATDPHNVLKVGNVRYASTKQTGGRVSVQGRVTKVFETPRDGAIQDGFISDDTGAIKFVIWEKSAWDDLASTAEPTADGRTVVQARRFPELQEGDLVRFENVFKSWYNEQPSLTTRRDSEITVLDRANDPDEDNQAAETGTTDADTTEPETAADPVTEYDVGVVPKHQVAYWRGATRWVFPEVSWLPDWWKAQDTVTRVGTADTEPADDKDDAGSPEPQSEPASESDADAVSNSDPESKSAPAPAHPPQPSVTANGGEPEPNRSATDATNRDTGQAAEMPVPAAPDHGDEQRTDAAEGDPNVASQEPDTTPCPTCGTEMTFDLISEHGTRKATTVYEGWWCSACGQGHQHCPACAELHHPDYECAPKRERRLQVNRKHYADIAAVRGKRARVPDEAIEDDGEWAAIKLEGGCPACGSDLTVYLHRCDEFAEHGVPEWEPVGEKCTQYDDDCDHRC